MLNATKIRKKRNQNLQAPDVSEALSEVFARFGECFIHQRCASDIYLELQVSISFLKYSQTILRSTAPFAIVSFSAIISTDAFMFSGSLISHLTSLQLIDFILGINITTQLIHLITFKTFGSVFSLSYIQYR